VQRVDVELRCVVSGRLIAIAKARQIEGDDPVLCRQRLKHWSPIHVIAEQSMHQHERSTRTALIVGDAIAKHHAFAQRHTFNP